MHIFKAQFSVPISTLFKIAIIHIYLKHILQFFYISIDFNVFLSKMTYGILIYNKIVKHEGNKL